jgi:hypothetical protein
MARNKADNLLFAYFERPVREYLQTLRFINASGGLSDEETERIRANAAEFHAEAILRHLAATR